MAWRKLAGAALAVLVTLAPRAAHAFQVRTTSQGKEVGWADSAIVLAVDPSMVHAVYAAVDAVNDSARAWHKVTVAPSIQVTRAAGGDEIGALGKNVVFFAPKGYGPAGEALAITLLRYEEDTGTILDADVVVNGAHTFAVLDPRARPAASTVRVANDDPSGALMSSTGAGGTFDLTHVIAHELGHVLGLRDETKDELALMYRFTSPNDASRRAPNLDDVRGISRVYSGARGHGCRASPSRFASHPRLSLCALGALGLFIVARRRRAAILAGSAALLLASAPEVARGDDEDPRGHARARVVHAETDARESVWSTRVSFAVEECRLSHCPAPPDVVVWGGRHEGVVQQVGEPAPLAPGDAVELTYQDLAPAATEGTMATRLTRALDPTFGSAR
jgi:hypothetical protein